MLISCYFDAYIAQNYTGYKVITIYAVDKWYIKHNCSIYFFSIFAVHREAEAISNDEQHVRFTADDCLELPLH